jgi:hypothetical protein
MQIAYLTTDEVNEHLALAAAAACGLQLVPLAPRDEPPGEGFDAVLCDWDYLPAPQQEEVLDLLPCRPAPCPVAVHSYRLEGKQRDAYRQRGLLVFRTLGPKVLTALRRVSRQMRAAARQAGSPDEKPNAGKHRPVVRG